MCLTRSAASLTGIPAAVTSNGRAEVSPQDGHGMGGRPERRFGHADHRHTELGMRMRAQARAAGRVEVGIAVDHQQAQPVDTAQHGA